VSWVVEVYGFKQVIPDASAVPAVSALIPDVNSQKPVTQEQIEKIKKQLEQVGSPPVIAKGLISVSVARSKASVEGKCSFFFVGKIPEGLYPGAWILATSISRSNKKELIRFVGQVTTVETNFQKQEDGTFVTSVRVTAREWSSILKMPVRYDIDSIQAAAQSSALGAVSSSASLLDAKNPAQHIEQAIRDSFDPFELAQLFLKLIGAMNEPDTLPKVKSTGDVKFPDVALTTPKPPYQLIKRLQNQSKSGFGSLLSESAFGTPSNNPFTQMVSVITGAHTVPFLNDGQWDGIFRSQTGSLSFFKDLMKSGYIPGSKPAVMGAAALMQLGAPVWDLITAYCEPSVNDFYTDILYEENSAGDVISTPCIVLRDKPFLMNSVKPLLNSDAVTLVSLSAWSLYDNVPRIRMPSGAITDITLHNTFQNSFNYIRVEPVIGGIDETTNKSLAAVNGVVRRSPEMERFGGIEHFVTTNFLGMTFPALPSPINIPGVGGNTVGNSEFFVGWFKQLKALSQAWHSFDYRMASGSLRIKDDNFAISLGFNMEFQFGNISLVGHVEAVNIDFMIDPISGLEQTHMTVSLSKIVESRSFGVTSPLYLLDPSRMSDIYRAGSDVSITGTTTGVDASSPIEGLV
jgi:hypothetical protein